MTESVLSGYYAWNVNTKQLTQDPNGNVIDTIQALATAVINRSSNNVSEINEYMAKLVLTDQESNPVIKDLLISMTQVPDYGYFFKNVRQEVDSYVKFYNDAPPGLQALLPKLHKKFHLTFEAGDVLTKMIRSQFNDPLLIPCMEALEKSPCKEALFYWFQIIRAKRFDRISSQYMEYLKELPEEWKESQFERFYLEENGFPYAEGFDWSTRNYKNKTGEEYDSNEWDIRFPLEECEDQAEVYILKQEGFAKAHVYGGQVEFGALMHQSVLIGASCLKEKKWSFKQLMAFAQLRRNHISFQLNQQGRGLFGLPTQLNKMITTPCNRQVYTALGKALHPLMEGVECVNKAKKIYQLKADFNVNGILEEPVLHDRIRLKEDGEAVVIHTADPLWRREIFRRVEACFNVSFTEQDPQLLVRRMGLVFYWICRGKFFDRGDPSIAEIIVRSYCLHRGITLGAWKVGVVPWEEVVKHLNPEEFADKFHTLFMPVETPPVLNGTESLEALADALEVFNNTCGVRIKKHMVKCVLSGRESNPIITGLLQAFVRSPNIHLFKNLRQEMETYWQFYCSAPPMIQSLMPGIHRALPYALERGEGMKELTESFRSAFHDSLLVPCLEVVANSTDVYALAHWLRVMRSKTMDKQTYSSLFPPDKFPKEWVKREASRIYTLDHGFAYSPGFEWSTVNYKNKTGEEYAQDEWDGRFPLHKCGGLMHQSILIGVYGLYEKSWKFSQLLALAQLRRNFISFERDEADKGEFGLPLLCAHNVNTYFSNAFFPAMAKALASLTKELECINDKEKIYQVKSCFKVDGFENLELCHDQIQVIGPENVRVKHTQSPVWSKEIYRRVEAYFNATGSELFEDKIIVRRMGLVYYWMCRGKFFECGDDSIAEIVVRSYCLSRGITLRDWKDGIRPWHEVLKSLDPEAFADKFHTLFESNCGFV